MSAKASIILKSSVNIHLLNFFKKSKIAIEIVNFFKQGDKTSWKSTLTKLALFFLIQKVQLETKTISVVKVIFFMVLG